MKKAIKNTGIVLLCIALLIAITFAGLFCYAAVMRGSRPLEASEWDMELDPGRDQMRVRLDCFGPNVTETTGTQCLTTINRTGEDLEEIVLRAYANGPESLGTGTRAVDVTGMYINDVEMPYAFDEDDPTILRVQYAWKSGEEIELRWHFNAPLSQDADMTFISLPVLGLWEDGSWREDAWDPMVQTGTAQAFDLELWMEYWHWDVVFGGSVLGYGDDPSGRISHVRMLGARDVSLMITQNQVTRWREIEGVYVSATADNFFAAHALLNTCEQALSSLNAAGIKYPFPSLSVVQTETGYEDGFSASGLILLGKDKHEAQLRRLTRLIARQTFGVLVGNDAWNDPWLSRTLASAAELMAYRARKGEKAYENRFFEEIEVATRLTRPYGVTVGAGIERFGDDTEMTQVLRDQGAAMMMGIEEAMGREAFVAALNRYASDNAFSIANRQTLESAFKAQSGSDWSGYLEDELAF